MRLRPMPEQAAELDNALTAWDRNVVTRCQGQWIWDVRYVLALSARALARRLGISQSALTKLELREAEGTITVAKLREVAQALGCDLVYVFVPHTSLEAQARETNRKQNTARRHHKKIPKAA